MRQSSELQKISKNHSQLQMFSEISHSNSLAVSFHNMRQRITNIAEAEKQRRSSRLTKGLNPNIPRPSKIPTINPQGKIGEDEQAQERANQIKQMDAHKIPLEELYQRLGANPNHGFSSLSAEQKNLKYGDNKLPEKKKEPIIIKFLKQISNWFAIMLWGGSILCIITYIAQPAQNLPNLYLAFVLMAVVLLTGTITYAQTAKSEALMESFKNLLPSTSKVLRDGKITLINSEKLVKGDIVEVISREKIPADLRILASQEMKVDNSPLTGQTQPLLRSPECSHPQNPLETKNLAFFGTLCKEGRGRGIVINIGSQTVMGQIADLAAAGGLSKTPLRIELDRFVVIITCIALGLGAIFFLLALFVVKYSILQCAIFGIGILVANVPQGLLACITISLAITAKKLSEKQVLVKNLEAVETLGSTSCICSDKTGTLTQNKMAVENLWYNGQIHKGDNKELKGSGFKYEYDPQDEGFRLLHHTAMICSEAKFDITDESIKTSKNFKYLNVRVIGDASQTALIKFFQPIEDITHTRSLYLSGNNKDGSDSKMPFNSTNKFALSIVKQKEPESQSVYRSYIKGAPQKIWKFCNRIYINGEYIPITQEHRIKFDQTNLKFGKNGERVLGFAMLPLPGNTFIDGFKFVTSAPNSFNFPLENYIFVGLISLIDPPKENVEFAIKKCHSAGIKVIMVTGDQPPTAAAIAKQIGIITHDTNIDLQERGIQNQEALRTAKAIVIHGDLINKAFSEGDEVGQRILSEWIQKSEIVFARTSPAQKLQIVKACQKSGRIVGVTGDGVNDSPAIKQGDIGISMGISGSDVTKDSADMILLNDDFSSIVDGIEQGRKIFDNLKKTIVYLLTSNMTEIWPFVALVFFRIPLPLSNIFMLCICVGTDIYPAISLAYEEAQLDIMTRRPRQISEHLVTMKLMVHAYGQMGEIATAGGFFSYFVVMRLYGFYPSMLFGLVNRETANPIALVDGILQADADYNIPYTFDLSNPTNFGCASLKYPCSMDNIYDNGFPDWLSTTNSVIDLRAFFTTCNKNTGLYQMDFQWPTDVLDTVSPVTNRPVAYTVQSLYYAQSAYFVTVVLVQWSNVFACKSRKVSLIYSGFNMHMFLGILVETALFIFLLYVPGVNAVFGGRPLQFFILGIPGLGFSMLLLCWQQSRKFLINRDSNAGKPNWWYRNLLW